LARLDYLKLAGAGHIRPVSCVVEGRIMNTLKKLTLTVALATGLMIGTAQAESLHWTPGPETLSLMS